MCGPQAVIENRRTATPVAVAGMRGSEGGSRGGWGMKRHEEAARRHRSRCRSQGGGGGAAGVGGGTHSQRDGAARRPLKLCEAEGSSKQGTAGRGLPDRAGAGCSGAVGPRLETPNGGGSWAPRGFVGTDSVFNGVRHRRASIRLMASTHDGEHPTHHSHQPTTHTNISHPNKPSCPSFSPPASSTATVAR